MVWLQLSATTLRSAENSSGYPLLPTVDNYPLLPAQSNYGTKRDRLTTYESSASSSKSHIRSFGDVKQRCCLFSVARLSVFVRCLSPWTHSRDPIDCESLTSRSLEQPWDKSSITRFGLLENTMNSKRDDGSGSTPISTSCICCDRRR